MNTDNKVRMICNSKWLYMVLSKLNLEDQESDGEIPVSLKKGFFEIGSTTLTVEANGNINQSYSVPQLIRLRKAMNVIEEQPVVIEFSPSSHYINIDRLVV